MPASAVLHLFTGLLLAPVLACAAVQDLRTRTIPNRLTATGAVVALAVRALVDPASLPGAMAWAAAIGLPLAGLAALVPGGMGMGDAKLGGVLGLALGPGAVIALLSACLLAVGGGVAVAIRDGAAAGRRLTLPMAPFLAAGATLAWACGWP